MDTLQLLTCWAAMHVCILNNYIAAFVSVLPMNTITVLSNKSQLLKLLYHKLKASCQVMMSSDTEAQSILCSSISRLPFVVYACHAVSTTSFHTDNTQLLKIQNYLPDYWLHAAASFGLMGCKLPESCHLLKLCSDQHLELQEKRWPEHTCPVELPLVSAQPEEQLTGCAHWQGQFGWLF